MAWEMITAAAVVPDIPVSREATAVPFAPSASPSQTLTTVEIPVTMNAIWFPTSEASPKVHPIIWLRPTVIVDCGGGTN